MKKIVNLVLLLLATSTVIGCIESNNMGNINESTVASNNVSPTENTDTSVIENGDGESIIIEDTDTIIEDTSPPTEEISIEDNVSSVVPGNETYENVSSHIFKVNDEYVMYTLNIRLIELFTEEGAAIIEVDGEQYRLIFDIEQKIKGHTAKIIDINGIDQTVEIVMK